MENKIDLLQIPYNHYHHYNVSFRLKDDLSPEVREDVRNKISAAFNNLFGKLEETGIEKDNGWMVFSGSGQAWLILGVGADEVLKDDYLFNSLSVCWWLELGDYGEKFDALEKYANKREEQKLGRHIPREYELPKEPDPNNPEYYARFWLKKKLSEEDRSYITEYILDAFDNEWDSAENRATESGEFFFAGDTEDMFHCIGDGLIAIVEDDRVWKNIAGGELCESATFDERYDIIPILKRMNKRAKRY